MDGFEIDVFDQLGVCLKIALDKLTQTSSYFCGLD